MSRLYLPGLVIVVEKRRALIPNLREAGLLLSGLVRRSEEALPGLLRATREERVE